MIGASIGLICQNHRGILLKQELWAERGVRYTVYNGIVGLDEEEVLSKEGKAY